MTLLRTLLLVAAACSGPPPTTTPTTTPATTAVDAPPPALALVETFPLETSLDHADIPDAHLVWLEMIEASQTTLDFAQFYASSKAGSRLEPIVEAVEQAAGRGVAVRFLSSQNFAATYPDTLARLRSVSNVEVRLIDGARYGGRGILHAKYFVADGNAAFLGSQNFDWRALTHIQELGVRTNDARVVGDLAKIFELDWVLANGGALPKTPAAPSGRWSGELELVASPRSALPAGIVWDHDRLVEIIEGARASIRIQLLSIRDDITELIDALAAAGKRGVEVRILVSNWNLGRGTSTLWRLAELPGVQVAFATIPPHSGGFIPYARVVHAKYMVADGERFWIGTSNWSRSYFHESRNVGVIARSHAIGAILERFFASGWDRYATVVESGRSYPKPTIE